MLYQLLTDSVGGISPPISQDVKTPILEQIFFVIGIFIILALLFAVILFSIRAILRTREKKKQKNNEQDLGTLTDEEKKIILEHRLKELNEKKDHSQHDKQH